MDRAVAAWGLVLLGLLAGMPPASAHHQPPPQQTLFSESWEAGTSGWALEESVTHTCGVGVASDGVCALYTDWGAARKGVDYATQHVLEVSTRFRVGTRYATGGGASLLATTDGQHGYAANVYDFGGGTWGLYMQFREGATAGASCSQAYLSVPTDTWLSLRMEFNSRSQTIDAVAQTPSNTASIRCWGVQFSRLVQVGVEGSDAHLDQLLIIHSGTDPTPPTNVQAAPTGARGEIRVSWGEPANDGGYAVTYYDLYRSTSATGPWSLIRSSWVHAHVDTGLPDGATRFYHVVAVTDAGASAPSTPASATTPTLPGAPSVSASGGPGAGEITVTWTVPSNGGSAIQRYKVYRADAAEGPYGLVKDGATSPYRESGFDSGETKHYRVTAVNGVGEGPYGQDSASALEYGAPSEPLALTATPGVFQTELAWQPPLSVGPGILHYRVYRAVESGPMALLAETGPQTRYVDTGCNLGRACIYQVTAGNRAGWGGPSNLAGTAGTALPFDNPVLGPLADQALDPDQDGASTLDELAANSNPLDTASTPDEDDNCDGTDNKDEGNLLAAQGVPHRWFRLEPRRGVVLDPDAIEDGGDLLVVELPAVHFYQEGGQEC